MLPYPLPCPGNGTTHAAQLVGVLRTATGPASLAGVLRTADGLYTAPAQLAAVMSPTQ
jgi:hypothetical protein